MSDVFPPISPYATGMLDVGDGNRMYWETSGNPDGKSAVVVHGGPGSGSAPSTRQLFDPELYSIILFDQRNCGRSTPHAADPSTDLNTNTTAHLIGDMERLRELLGVSKWLIYGGSWGSTLALAYAQTHPERVSEMVIAAVTTTRRSEIDWLYRGVARYFPEAWEQFVAGSGVSDADDLLQGYVSRLESRDRELRARAVDDWCAWEDAVLSTEQAVGNYSDRERDARTAMVRICAHYFSHLAWLDEDQLIRNAHVLNGIPGVLVHGRADMGSPPETAWLLKSRWDSSQLTVVDDSGHRATDQTRALVTAAIRRFAR